MSIRIVPDVLAPVTVSAVDIVARKVIPKQADWAVYAMSVLGYAGALMNFGGDYVKNIGVSSLPLSINQLYSRITGTPISRVAYARTAVNRYPAPATSTQFQGTRLV
jgi:hypothetical protein